MESLPKGIAGVVVYIDDILVTGLSDEEHLKSLEETLKRLEDANLRLKLKNCYFIQTSVTYLGHRIDEQGVHPVPDKVKAVQEAPEPQNVAELKSYLGLLTYYSRFLPDMASKLAPLYGLLGKSTAWRWEEEERSAFQGSKELLASSQVLVHYNPKLELSLACDASAYGIGAVLSQVMPTGEERPVGLCHGPCPRLRKTTHKSGWLVCLG